MQTYDVTVLGQRLNDLAEVFDKKPVSEKGLTVWFSVLREFPTEKVCSILIAWPKTHTKFPAPAEVWKAVNEMSTGEREEKSKREKEVWHPGVGGAQAEKFIAQMREVLKRPKWTPTEHWQRVFETQEPGSIGHTYATEVLEKKGLLKHPEIDEREAGQDDEERAVNF